MKRKTCLLLILALALTLLAACGPKENCAEAHNDDRTYRLHMCTDKEKYDFGEPVSIIFTVTNVSDESLTLDGGDEPALDICIRSECWSEGQEMTPELTRVTLESGGSRAITWVWPTADTDLEALERDSPPTSTVGGLVFGSVIPWPDASPRSVWVSVVYRRP
jgi:hypothetical protein